MDTADTTPVAARPAIMVRTFAWGMMATLAAFLVNNYLTAARDWPGISPLIGGDASALSFVQLAIYIASIAAATALVVRTANRSLRADSAVLNNFSMYLARAAFFAILLVGVGDTVVSALRVENSLGALLGDALANEMNRAHFRGPYLHMPLILLGFVLAFFTRSLGFIWLTLLVVLSEFAIVIMGFVYSYEQSYMGDLVRFWHAALFLFASAFTLYEEGHVRVDVLYASFKSRTKAFFNIWGSVLFGITFCWTIIIIGMSNRAAIINSPMLNYEISQAGFGLYVKYLMAGLLGMFAILMLVQFTSYLLESVADYRNEVGARTPSEPIGH